MTIVKGSYQHFEPQGGTGPPGRGGPAPLLKQVFAPEGPSRLNSHEIGFDAEISKAFLLQRANTFEAIAASSILPRTGSPKLCCAVSVAPWPRH